MGYTIRCGGHKYITLEYDGKFIRCYDNDFYSNDERIDCYYTEHIIEQIEKRTGKKINEIPIKGHVEDFDGLRFLYGGFKKGTDWLSK